jgi:hypothetical protein
LYLENVQILISKISFQIWTFLNLKLLLISIKCIWKNTFPKILNVSRYENFRISIFFKFKHFFKFKQIFSLKVCQIW